MTSPDRRPPLDRTRLRPPARMTLPILAGLLLAASTTPAVRGDGAAAASPAGVTGDTVTLERIMADPDWLGNAPEGAYWSADGETIYFQRKRAGAPTTDLWRVARDGGSAERVDDAELGRVEADRVRWSPDRTKRFFDRNGDLFVADSATGDLMQLTRTRAREQALHFLADGTGVVFARDDDVLIRELASGLEREAVDLRAEDDPAEEDPADDFLARTERRLIEIVREWREDEIFERERERELRRADPTRLPPAIYLGEDVVIEDRQLSPAGDWMLVVTAPPKRDRGKQDRMPSYVARDGYVEVRDVRAKVGTADPVDHGLFLIDLAAGEARALDLGGLPGIIEDPLAAIKAATAEAREAENEAENEAGDQADGKRGDKGGEAEDESKDGDGDGEDKPRPVEIERIVWTVDGSRAAVQFHSYDNKDRWIAIVDADGEVEPIHHLSDPGGWINWFHNDMGWLRDGRRLWFLSEESGWSQLYLHDAESGGTERLTDGDFVTSDVELDPDERHFYFTANVAHPGTYDTYRLPVGGGDLERMTALGGITRSRLSPDGRFLLSTHSTTTRPAEIYVQRAEPGAEAERVTDTTSDAYLDIDWTAPEIVGVPSSHVDRPIWSRLYTPDGDAGTDLIGDDGRRPAVVFVHGAGYLQNAHRGWSGYFREFMFHTLLTRRGYVVLDMDYRASRGYGRDWRTAIYRQMGHPEVEDLVDGVAYLAAEHDVDPSRVGVYGGSYGGFLTFMSMFREPDLFAAGAALRPVTDWAHYNHPYTSNILNTPEVDPEAYKKSSPIEFAEGLRKPLLICAGMLDDNVFFQDTVRLVQRLIELEKTDFETAFYPIEPHGFQQPSSWLDEYRRIFALFERYLVP